ncbi:phytanoyl-CoA dioxygenase family protein [Halioglobus japonicus]|nr:phytanoyl-CoA dioxygenase family protein [Halioglobus japonicus]
MFILSYVMLRFPGVQKMSTDITKNERDIDAVLEQAQTLIAANGPLAAIDYLMQANRAYSSRRLERELVSMRVAGFRQLERPPVSWSAEADNRFDNAPGLPEISASELSADALRSGILGKGGLIVRGLLNNDRADEVREWISKAVYAHDSQADEHTTIPAEDAAWYKRSPEVEGSLVKYDRSVWAVDSPPAAFGLATIYRDLGLREILQEYFGEPAMLSVRKWVMRCVPPNNGGESGWHQDGRFMGQNIRTVNLWLSLTDCGEGAEAPGIDIVADNSRKIYPTGTHNAPFDWTVGQGLVDEIAGHYPVQRPRFAPGDAVFFDHFNLHRTGFGTVDKHHRYAVESWFFAASLAPEAQQPLLF